VQGAVDLSVGEQQRLALVRLILAKPDWAFLDEATSALDLETEKLAMSLLRAELPDTTFVIVAHREPQGLGCVRNVPLGVGLCRSCRTTLYGWPTAGARLRIRSSPEENKVPAVSGAAHRAVSGATQNPAASPAALVYPPDNSANATTASHATMTSAVTAPAVILAFSLNV
jgi:ABC-type sulfate/molybdate transport systems ATPase subunit